MNNSFRSHVLALSLLAFSGLAVGGCTPGGVTTPTANEQGDPAPAPTGDARQPRETWDVFYMGEAKIGYAHTQYKPRTVDGQHAVEISSTHHIKMRRFGQVVTQQLKLSSVETRAGSLLECRSEMSTGTGQQVTEGRRTNGKLQLRTSTQGVEQQDEIEWSDEWGGFFATERSLEEDPLSPGERRTLRALMPMFNEVVRVELVAEDYEATRLLTGSHRLLRIASTTHIGSQPPIESIMWMDSTGQTLKSLVPALGQLSYRATKELALDQTGAATFDLGERTIVRVGRLLPAPHQARRIVYRARLGDGDPAAIFVSGPSQSVDSIDPHTARVTVRAIRPGDAGPGAVAEADRPTRGDLDPGNLIQSNDPHVLAMARRVAAGESDPWKVAVALERHVHRTIRAKNFSTAFATAAEVAQTLQGDCTEHAVLLAALCRAQKIPARVAIGLVYYAEERGFAYHMWNEVWIKDRWVPMDATLGQAGIGAAHLKLAESNLEGASAYSSFLPVLQVLGRLELEILEVDS